MTGMPGSGVGCAHLHSGQGRQVGKLTTDTRLTEWSRPRVQALPVEFFLH